MARYGEDVSISSLQRCLTEYSRRRVVAEVFNRNRIDKKEEIAGEMALGRRKRSNSRVGVS